MGSWADSSPRILDHKPWPQPPSWQQTIAAARQKPQLNFSLMPPQVLRNVPLPARTPVRVLNADAVFHVEPAKPRPSTAPLRKSSVHMPSDACALTAHPDDDFESDPGWIELARTETTADAPAFWHIMSTFTRELHWVRQFFSVQVLDEAFTPEHPQSPISVVDPRSVGAPPARVRYTAVRELLRKTPAPIGGGPNGTDPSFVAHEWTTQYVAGDRHVAVFGLVVPVSVAGPDNPRAMTFWPFQYPKARAYRFEWTPGAQPGDAATISFGSIPLGIDVDGPVGLTRARSLEATMEHVRRGAAKQTILVRKRAERFDSTKGQSTYVKKVVHDALVPEMRYREHYNRLKARYAHWVSSWGDTEVTDPVKFVFEEMAIAAYLCALWEIEREKMDGGPMQSFVDAGCGNGFLVYLLRMEGHPGIGLDIRRRKIWARYPPHVAESLFEETVKPEDVDVTAFDWIIGNHSDELTCWLPAIAARAQRIPAEDEVADVLVDGTVRQVREASPKLFILPCCFFDFDGKKLQFGNRRRTVPVPHKGCDGKYEQYIQWISRLCTAYGWNVEMENLRIPSTKYKSLICRSVAHEDQMRPEVMEELTRLLVRDAELCR